MCPGWVGAVPSAGQPTAVKAVFYTIDITKEETTNAAGASPNRRGPCRSTVFVPPGGYCAQVIPPETGWGKGLLSVVLSPSWPWRLYPQQRASPVARMPQVW